VSSELLAPEVWSRRLFSHGWEEGAGGDAAVIEPATGEELGRVGLASPGDVRSACEAAGRSQPGWASTPFEERAALMRRAAGLWEVHAAECEGWIVRETGSTPGKAAVETRRAAQEAYEAATLPSHPLGEVLPSATPRLSIARQLPVGVVGAIAPFNFPLALAMGMIAPALALGNAVVLKPDPRSAVSGGVAIARVFEEAGLPAGVLHVLPGGAEVGEALVEDDDVSMIAFTGSTAGGRRVAERAARQLKRVHLELGGNSAIVVLDDADLERAVGAAGWASFLHQGQICMTAGRHIVHADIADEYVERLSAAADAIQVGNPATEAVGLGPLIDADQRDRVHALVSTTVGQGATVTAGGRYEELFYRPTVLADVPLDAPAWSQEVFGPVAPVVRFATLEEAARLARETPYGLAFSIMTADVMKGLAFADGVPSGVVHVNDQTVADDATVPFGGVGASGNGARLGGAKANIEAFTATQWVTVCGEIPPYSLS